MNKLKLLTLMALSLVSMASFGHFNQQVIHCETPKPTHFICTYVRQPFPVAQRKGEGDYWLPMDYYTAHDQLKRADGVLLLTPGRCIFSPTINTPFGSYTNCAR